MLIIIAFQENHTMTVKSSVTVCLIPEATGGPFILWNDLNESILRAADLGFDAIELFPPEPDAVDPGTLAQTLSKRGLQISAVGSGAGWVRHKLLLTHPDSTHREKAISFVRGMIDFAAKLNAPVIIGSMQGRWGEGQSKERTLELLAESLNILGEHARSQGQILIYEPLNRYETNLINTIEDGVAYLKQLSTRNIRLLADLFHMNIEESNIANAILLGGKNIGHFHFADSNRRPAGFGHTDFASIVEAVRNIGFSGYFAAEAFAFPNPLDAAKQTITKFKELFPS
jgi:sugar phosphate isomerase/epimerase